MRGSLVVLLLVRRFDEVFVAAIMLVFLLGAYWMMIRLMVMGLLVGMRSVLFFRRLS